MQHGRNHDERQHHMHHPRANNLPEDGETAIEAAFVRTGRKATHGGPPREPEQEEPREPEPEAG
jgi:hypothetical protein